MPQPNRRPDVGRPRVADGVDQVHFDPAHPRTVAQGVRPTAIRWSPNNDRLAFGHSDVVRVVDLACRTLWNIQLGKGADPSSVARGDIMDLQWHPTGQMLALIAGNQVYTVNSDGTDLHGLDFRATDDVITSFSWSPDGLRFALPMVTPNTCHFAMRADTFQECHSKFALFVSARDGGQLQWIPGTDFEAPPRPYTNLFWSY